jgi:hypothetical protein
MTSEKQQEVVTPCQKDMAQSDLFSRGYSWTVKCIGTITPRTGLQLAINLPGFYHFTFAIMSPLKSYISLPLTDTAEKDEDISELESTTLLHQVRKPAAYNGMLFLTLVLHMLLGLLFLSVWFAVQQSNVTNHSKLLPLEAREYSKGLFCTCAHRVLRICC